MEPDEKPLAHRVAQMAAFYDVDVVLLAECETPLSDVEAVLNQKGIGLWGVPFSVSPKLHLLTRLNTAVFSDLCNDPNGRLSIRLMRVANSSDLLVALVHFPSKTNYDQNDQTLMASVMANRIALVENDNDVLCTVVAGDMNMEPV